MRVRPVAGCPRGSCAPLARELGAAQRDLQWIVDAYTAFLAGLRDPRRRPDEPRHGRSPRSTGSGRSSRSPGSARSSTGSSRVRSTAGPTAGSTSVPAAGVRARLAVDHRAALRHLRLLLHRPPVPPAHRRTLPPHGGRRSSPAAVGPHPPRPSGSRIAQRAGVNRVAGVGLLLTASGLGVISLLGTDFAYLHFAAGLVLHGADTALAGTRSPRPSPAARGFGPGARDGHRVPRRRPRGRPSPRRRRGPAEPAARSVAGSDGSRGPGPPTRNGRRARRCTPRARHPRPGRPPGRAASPLGRCSSTTGGRSPR